MAKGRKRTTLDETPQPGDLYGLREPTVETFSSGCTLLDCVLGGGWAYNRVSNIVGDRSTGKTLLVIEAAANFAKANKTRKIVYAESEAAFDQAHAYNLGMPVDEVDFPNVFTVEDVFKDIEARLSSKERTLYIVDSLDALSDLKEQGRDMDAGTYGTKSKAVSEWFRRQNKRLSQSNITLMVVSQVRDNIGVTFGEKNKRSGGRALDFYASQALWLANLGQIVQIRLKDKRTVGVRIRAKCKKNKIGPAFRECEVPIVFGYGVEDVKAGLEWLVSVDRSKDVGLTKEQAEKLVGGKQSLGKLFSLDADAYDDERRNISEAVLAVWKEVETAHQPTRRKYR